VSSLPHRIPPVIQDIARHIRAVGHPTDHCAGAGLPDHVHAHVVPRWTGDTNYMAVLGNTRVVPDTLDALYKELVTNAQAAGLRD